ncbi:hypothetical protein ABES08_03350 [Peribacillus simplex]|uniref:Uncharacterized protein n=1 Tax=Peribacillus simplex TaxID=1478 RepID=A0AAW7IY79_9BACI|nr:hypothetical protein [Peribacillus simplex]AMM91855.1 hypothetical protein UP17_04200 [Peribacillus simplex]MDM5455187.1 hypothetical protein [Peribacillus simplex]
MKFKAASLVIAGSLILPSFALAESEDVSTIYDTTLKATKTFEAVPLDDSISVNATKPYYVAKSSLYRLGGSYSTSRSYTSSAKTKSKAIDLIYAKTKHYVKGALQGSASDTEKNSSRAGAEVNYGKQYPGDWEVFGSHKFQHKGYKTWQPETYDT